MPEELAALIGELGAMAPDDRAVVLAALTRRERDLIEQLTLRDAPLEGADEGSPWLMALVARARAGDPVMTQASRDALLEAVGIGRRVPPAAGRSLAGAFGGLLAARGGAR